MPSYRLFALLSLSILLASAPACCNGLHAVDWKRYDTEHFSILFHDAVRPQADIARKFLEPAYAKIAKDLGMKERGVRISVVLSGRPDESNGSATPLGHTILIYTRPAQVMAAGDIAWLKRVLAHELAHQITFLALRKGFWGIWSELYKTSHMPAWFMEGLAQYEAETWDAKRNTFFAHALYNSALEAYPDLAVYTKMSPVANRLVYEQGHAFVRFLADREGPEFWARVLKRIRVIPVWSEIKALLSPLTAGILPLEGAIRAESGTWTGRHYRDFTDSLRAALPPKAAPATASASATAWKGGIPGFAVVWQIRQAPDGTLWFTGQRKWETAVTGLYTLRAGEVETEVGSGVDPIFDLSPDGKRVLYVRTYADRHRDAVEKLFLLAAGDSRFISDGASHPVFWGADSLAFSHYRQGRQALAFCAVSGGCRESAPDSLDGFYALSLSQRGMLLNAVDAQGCTGIYEYAREGGFTRLFSDSVTAEFPLEAADGSVWMLHDRNGLLQIDGLDRVTGAVNPVATFPLGACFPQRVAPGVFAAVSQTGDRKHWILQPAAIQAQAAPRTDSVRTDSSVTAPVAVVPVPAPDSTSTFQVPGFLEAPVPDFPLDSVPFEADGYNSVTAMRPLIAGPSAFNNFDGGTLGAFIAMADPVGFNSLSVSTAANGGDPLYEIEYVNDGTATRATLVAVNTNYAFREIAPVYPYSKFGLERRSSEYSLRLDFPMPTPLPLGHHVWLGLKLELAAHAWRLAGSEDTTAMKLLKGGPGRTVAWSKWDAIPQLLLAYSYFRPNAYGLVHPLLKTDLEVLPGYGLSDFDKQLLVYARQTFPIWSELTFTARYQLDLYRQDWTVHRISSTDAVAFYSGGEGEVHDIYAGLDFPIHKGYMGELPLFGLWNYVGGGFYFGYQREAYIDFPDRPGSGFEGETGAAGAKVDMLFHVMRRVPLVLSAAVQYDYLREDGEFRIGAEVEGIPRSFSLFGARKSGFGSAGRDRLRVPVRPRQPPAACPSPPRSAPGS